MYNHLVENEEWMEDLHAADVIFVASHSQGAVVSTHLIDRLIEDGHILTARSVDTLAKTAAAIAAGGSAPISAAQAQKVCLLALCGVHLGPLRYLKTSSWLQAYAQASRANLRRTVDRNSCPVIISMWRMPQPGNFSSSR